MIVSRTDAPEPRRYRIVNRRSEALTLVLEPWANEYPFPSGDKLEIIGEGVDSDDALEIHLEAAHVVVYARTATFLRLFRNGVEVS